MKVIFIVGPTATGKTDVAVRIAKELNGELINADSRQVYSGLNIGTNKGALEEKDGVFTLEVVPIHLVNILKTDQRFSLFEFQKMAQNKILEITSRGRIPIVVGGTGLYIDALVRGYELSDSSIKPRSDLENLTAAQLRSKIPENILKSLNESDFNNTRRLIRIVEKGNNDKLVSGSNFESLILYPNYNWDDLKMRISKRVEEMFQYGLIDETTNLLNITKRTDPAMEIMGYKEVIKYLDKEIDLNTCKERVKIAHNQYAKRQRTWFEGKGRDYKLNKFNTSQEAVVMVSKFLKNET